MGFDPRTPYRPRETVSRLPLQGMQEWANNPPFWFEFCLIVLGAGAGLIYGFFWTEGGYLPWILGVLGGVAGWLSLSILALVLRLGLVLLVIAAVIGMCWYLGFKR